jgi:hypothetical protein
MIKKGVSILKFKVIFYLIKLLSKVYYFIVITKMSLRSNFFLKLSAIAINLNSNSVFSFSLKY